MHVHLQALGMKRYPTERQPDPHEHRPARRLQHVVPRGLDFLVAGRQDEKLAAFAWIGTDDAEIREHALLIRH